MSTIISVNDLHKNYGTVHAVQGVSFQVKAGGLFAFLGPNGAGKSTTINILCTLLPFSKGNISIADYELGVDDGAIRQQIGIVFQESMLDPLLTVRENLTSRGALYGLSDKELADKIADLSTKMDFTDFIDRPYGKLSGGQKRRIDIARAIIHSPKVLFLDEPTTGLDPQTRAKVWEIIYKLKEDTNTTIFFSTHYMEEANVADEVAIIDYGKIIAQGTPEELRFAHSNDVLKLNPKNIEFFEGKLKQSAHNYKLINDVFTLPVKNSMAALKIIKEFEEELIGFEVIRGSMDEVFLNLTGRKIREGGDIL